MEEFGFDRCMGSYWKELHEGISKSQKDVKAWRTMLDEMSMKPADKTVVDKAVINSEGQYLCFRIIKTIDNKGGILSKEAYQQLYPSRKNMPERPEGFDQKDFKCRSDAVHQHVCQLVGNSDIGMQLSLTKNIPVCWFSPQASASSTDVIGAATSASSTDVIGTANADVVIAERHVKRARKSQGVSGAGPNPQVIIL